MAELSKSKGLDIALSCILVCCAVAVTWRMYRPKLESPIPLTRVLPAGEWDELSAAGNRIGPETAAVTIVEFGDFQCPACRQFALQDVRSALKEHPGEVALVFRHWPLARHPASYPAARAAECAAAQGRFAEYHDALFAGQELVEAGDWWSFADRIGGIDSAQFARCLARETRIPAIERDIVLAQQSGAPGTPVMFINGLAFNRQPSPPEIRAIIDSILGVGGAK